MKDAKRITVFALIGGIVAIVLALTSCSALKNGITVSGNGQTATCKAVNGNVTNGVSCAADGKSVTVAPATSHHHSHKSSVPVASPVPTVTATASIPGATAPAPDPTQAVTTCLGPVPSQDTLVSFTKYDSSQAKDLAVCLAIPPSTMKYFLWLLWKYAVNANNSGQFSSDQGRTQFADDTVAPTASKCHYGQAE